MSSTTRHLLAPSAVRWATRLGPSRRCPGAVGVFAAAHLKKYTPVEVVPNCITATADFSPPELQHEAREMAKTTTTLVRAPPQLLKLTAAPRGTISLRRFLALRQHMCSGSYLHVATLSAWYVLVPSYTVPLDDEVGLQRWCDLHHHRYYSPARRPRQQRRRRGRGGEGDALQQFRMNKFDELAQMEEEGVEQRTTTTTTTNEEDTSLADDDNDEDGDELVEHMSSTNTNNRVLQQAPMALPERHLFEINDGVHLPLPPTDDVAHEGYWRQLGPRMMLYRSAHDLSREDYDAYITEILDATPQTSSSITTTEQERLLAGQYAFQALTEKANVQLEVSDVSGLVTLKPLMDIAEGDELLLHYGREWWMHRLMWMLVLAATSGAEMARVRPLEQLCMEVCGEPTDVREGFPMLMPVWRKPDSRRSRVKKKKKRGTLSSSSSTSSALTLLNLTTNAEATSEAVLAFAIRQSCFDKKWLTSLVHTHTNDTRNDTNSTRNDDDEMNASSSAVFHRERPDEEVPVAQLRRALAEHLRRHGPTTTAAAEVDETTASIAPLPPSVALDVLSEDVVDGDEDEESPEQHFSV